MAKAFRSFRFNPQIYENFKALASKSGFTVTAALEKFMSASVEFGLEFPSAKTEDSEREARILLVWLEKKQYWIPSGEEEVSTVGRMLELLPKIQDADLKLKAEQTLKSMFGSMKKTDTSDIRDHNDRCL